MRLEACKLSYSDRDLSDQELSEYLLVTASGILTPNIIRMYCMHLQDLAKGFPSPSGQGLLNVQRVLLELCVTVVCMGFLLLPWHVASARKGVHWLWH